MSGLTVGIPCYYKDNPNYLDLAIHSVINQTLPPYEIHLIQDGELNNALNRIIKHYSENKKIRILRLETNSGLAKALNKSIMTCNTKYYARMDADDISAPDRFEKQLKFLEINKHIDILGTWAYDIDNYGKITGTRKTPVTQEAIIKYIWSNPFVHPSVMFNKDSLIRKVGLYNEKLIKRQDYELWFRCANAGLKMANIPEPLIYYRFSEEWFQKNNASVIWEQVKIGWQGCRKIHASYYAYIAVTVPLLKVLFPGKIGIRLTKLLRFFDPRYKG